MKLSTPLDIANVWMSYATLITEAHSVVAYRLMGMGGAWSVPRGENHAMLREKGPAFTEAMVASTMTAIKGGAPDKIMAAAIKPLSKKARANRKRLGPTRPQNPQIKQMNDMIGDLT